MATATATHKPLPLIYQQIKQQILDRLAHSDPGTRLPPIEKLSTELNVGRSNTHRAVRELVRDGILVSRPGRGTFVCQMPQVRRAARVLESPRALAGKRITIMRSLVDSFVVPAVLALTDELTAAGAIVECSDRHIFESAGLSSLSADQAHAVILVNPNVPRFHSQPGQHLLIISSAPTVPVEPGSRADSVIADSELGGMVAGQWMKQIGCKSACFMGVYDKLTGRIDATSAPRLAGFEQGFGQSVPEGMCIRASRYQTTSGANRVQTYLSLNPRPEGIFAACDDLAFGFLHGALAYGLRPGIDFQLIGFDGQERARSLPGASLTTVQVPMAEMGRTGARLLIDRFARPALPPRRVILGVDLYKGSTAVPLAERQSGSETGESP